jgi:hypothetical protein
MDKRTLWSRILCIIGLAMMTIGAVAFAVLVMIRLRDWFVVLFLIFLILPVSGTMLVALGAFLGKSRYRKFLYVVPALTACGLIMTYIVWVSSMIASGSDLEGATYSIYPWEVFAQYAYPVGAVMSSVGAVLVILESLHGPPVSGDTAETAQVRGVSQEVV